MLPIIVLTLISAVLATRREDSRDCGLSATHGTNHRVSLEGIEIHLIVAALAGYVALLVSVILQNIRVAAARGHGLRA